MQVDGIADLPKLLVLDVSFNSIQAFDASQLPTSLRFLQVSWGCPWVNRASMHQWTCTNLSMHKGVTHHTRAQRAQHT